MKVTLAEHVYSSREMEDEPIGGIPLHVHLRYVPSRYL